MPEILLYISVQTSNLHFGMMILAIVGPDTLLAIALVVFNFQNCAFLEINLVNGNGGGASSGRRLCLAAKFAHAFTASGDDASGERALFPPPLPLLCKAWPRTLFCSLHLAARSDGKIIASGRGNGTKKGENRKPMMEDDAPTWGWYLLPNAHIASILMAFLKGIKIKAYEIYKQTLKDANC